jgi:hypothetical protein
MAPVSIRRLMAAMLAGVGFVVPVALAQQAPAAAPPPWQQGRAAEQTSSTLHPFVPQMTGRPASELPLEKLKVPTGFKV